MTPLGHDAADTLDANALARACIAAIYVGESQGDYRILCGGKAYHYTDGRHFSDFSHFPEWGGQRGPWGVSHAAGAPQFEPATYRSVQEALGLPDFSPRSQDIGCWYLAESDYHRRTHGASLLHDLADAKKLPGIATALKETWTSLDPKLFPKRFQAAMAQLKAKPAPTVTVHPVLHTGSSLTLGGAVAAIGSWMSPIVGGPTVPQGIEEAFAVVLSLAGAWAIHRIVRRLA